MTLAPFDPAALAQRRLDNALALFDEFVAQTVTDPDSTALRGLERRFAEKVLIQPSYWSQIKSRHRQIGERLARQFEQRCRKPAGWMDQAHDHGTAPRLAEQVPSDDAPPDTSSTPRDDDERFIVGLVLSYYRRHPKRARQRLLDLLGEVLTPPLAASASGHAGPGGAGGDRSAAQAGASSKPTAPAPDDALWLQASRGVAPLKRGR